MIQEIGFALDSPLEEAGFEPAVPPGIGTMVFARALWPDFFPEKDSRVRALYLPAQQQPCDAPKGIDRQMSPQTSEAMTKRDRRPGGVEAFDPFSQGTLEGLPWHFRCAPAYAQDQ